MLLNLSNSILKTTLKEISRMRSVATTVCSKVNRQILDKLMYTKDQNLEALVAVVVDSTLQEKMHTKSSSNFLS